MPRKLSVILPIVLLAQLAWAQEKVMICVSATAHAYHNSYCQGMRACKHRVDKISMKEAKELGKDPCGYCYKGASGTVRGKSPASGQCSAMTKKGTRCSRSSRSGGYCWQHGV